MMKARVIMMAVALAAFVGSAAGRAEWMRGSFGLSVHWTAQCALEDGTQLPFEEAVNRFDVERFAEALESVGARHCIFTITHGLQKMPCPNAALDAIDPGRTTKRDLVGELISALGKRGIRFVAYYNHSCNGDFALVKEWKKKCSYPCDDDGTGNMETFASNYCAIVSDLSRRYGNGISAWWFDSPYSVDTSGPYRACKGTWRFPWARLIAAARSGNESAAVAINAGIGRHFLYSPDTDYHAGESGDKDQAFTPADPGLVDHRWMCLDSPEWVFSSSLAKKHGGFAPPRYSPETLRDYVRIHTAAGRMVTLNVLVDQLGRLNPALRELDVRRGQTPRECCKTSRCGTFLATAMATASHGETRNAVRRTLDEYVLSGRIAGVVSILSDADCNLTVDCSGWANIEKRVPISTNTVFAIFSMTKTITGAAGKPISTGWIRVPKM